MSGEQVHPGPSRPVIARPVIGGRRGGRIVLDGVDTLMLGSNDYLGLSTNPRVLARTVEALEQYGAGTGLYPVFATTPLHDALCGRLRSFLGVEAVLLFSSGGSANAGVLATLAGEEDAIVSDQLNHASIIDACRLSRARVVPYANRDAADLRAALDRTRSAKRRLVVTDGIFSMEGGAAPLGEIYSAARDADALLVVDEAHAIAVVGPRGTGTAPLKGIPNAAPGLLLTGSLSKALGGASGGFVAGPAEFVSALQHASRSWIFTMGMTTASAATADAALEAHQAEPGLLDALWRNVACLRRSLAVASIPVLESDSAITAVLIGDEERARAISQALLQRGIYAPAMVHPTVARGVARLRLQVSAAHSTGDLEAAAAELADVMRGLATSGSEGAGAMPENG